MKPVVEGVKLISHNMGRIDNADDPTFPFKLFMTCEVPKFMDVAASFIYGKERVVIRGKTLEAIEKITEVNEFKRHPRLLSLSVVNTDTNELVWSVGPFPQKLEDLIPKPFVSTPVRSLDRGHDEIYNSKLERRKDSCYG